MQTAVEWLIDQMFKQGYFDGNKPLSITNLDHLQHQAKEMEKQQMLDCYLKSDVFPRKYEFEKWFAETYVSKGSDDIKGIGSKDINGNEFVFPTYSQTEISDEEIEEESWRYREATKDMEIPPNEDWSNGAQWYREQLKKKQ